MSTQITISNCNNIKHATIEIQEGKLNIFYGRNGTGKSTIAKSIKLNSDEISLDNLAPYGTISEELQPSVIGNNFKKVVVFNEGIVNQYIFQKDSLIANAFNIFIRTPAYDDARNTVDAALQNIKKYFTDAENIINLRNNIAKLISAIKLSSSGTLTGNIKKVAQEGKGAYFKLSPSLKSLNDFCTDDIVSDWASWRLKGNQSFGNKGKCPYCSVADTEQSIKLNTAFNECFTKGSIETAQAIKQSLKELENYIDSDQVSKILGLFGTTEKSTDFSDCLIALVTEATRLNDRLNNIISFNSFTVNYEDISTLEIKLNDMKIDSSLNVFFKTEAFNTEITTINNEIDNLITGVGVLKAAIAKSQRIIETSTKEKEDDINKFLTVAGFNYHFKLTTDAEGQSRATLQFKLPDGNISDDILTPKEHLSWGERNAFALVLFMFMAIAENADLIILDDPISSFDGIKKYAIMHRLFQPGSKTKSLAGRTVLLLTHNFEPIIDYIHTPSGVFKGSSDSRCATYIENNHGNIRCITIEREDIISTHLMWKELATDKQINPVVRIAALRKFIEHQEIDKTVNPAYHILSSLIHGRSVPCQSDNTELSRSDQDTGISQIKQFISDFTYETYAEIFKIEELKRQLIAETEFYYKTVIFRALTEQLSDLRRALANRDSVRKYVDETFHIEDDYIYTLDIRKFNIIPTECIEAINSLFNDSKV